MINYSDNSAYTIWPKPNTLNTKQIATIPIKFVTYILIPIMIQIAWYDEIETGTSIITGSWRRLPLVLCWINFQGYFSIKPIQKLRPFSFSFHREIYLLSK